MEARDGTSILDFETLFSDFQEWLNGSGLTVAPTTNFARMKVKTRYLTLLRATKNSVVFCRASLLYEMRYSFRSTLFVATDFASHLCGGSISVTIVHRPALEINTMHYVTINQTDPIYMVCRRLSSTLVHNTPPRPGLFLSARPEFVERGEFNFSRSWPLKKTCQHIFHQITTPPRSSDINLHPDRAAAFSTYLVNDDQEHTWLLTCKKWYVRTSQ